MAVLLEEPIWECIKCHDSGQWDIEHHAGAGRAQPRIKDTNHPSRYANSYKRGREMRTSYIRFVQMYADPVWGDQALDWMRTDMIRVTRNNLGNAVFEWVGNPKAKIDIDDIRRDYQVAMYS
jgi:hypothetical protein